MNILIIEDVFLARQTLKQLLQRFNITVDEAQRGNNAMELIKINEYDYILIDLGLPDINGIDLIKKIREYGNKSKIIVTSGHSERDTLFKCIIAGADHYLVKPLDFERMKEIIFDN